MGGGEAEADRAGLGRAALVICGKPRGRAIIVGLAISVADDARIQTGQQRQLTGDSLEADDVVARNGPGMQQNGRDR